MFWAFLIFPRFKGFNESQWTCSGTSNQFQFARKRMVSGCLLRLRDAPSFWWDRPHGGWTQPLRLSSLKTPADIPGWSAAANYNRKIEESLFSPPLLCGSSWKEFQRVWVLSPGKSWPVSLNEGAQWRPGRVVEAYSCQIESKYFSSRDKEPHVESPSDFAHIKGDSSGWKDVVGADKPRFDPNVRNHQDFVSVLVADSSPELD